YLLDAMARLGNGAVAYLSLNDDANQVMSRYFDRISHPALRDISIDFGGMKVADVYPQKLPDLFVGRPILLTGKFTGDAPTTITVHGKTGSQARDFKIAVKGEDLTAKKNAALASLWARMKIEELSDRAAIDEHAAVA